MAAALFSALGKAFPFERKRNKRRGLGDPMHLPPNLRPVDPCFAAEWASGSLTLAGHTVDTAGCPQVLLTHRNAPEAWYDALHSFAWLAGVPMSGDDAVAVAARERCRDFVAVWLDTVPDKLSEPVTRTARRMLSFLANADLVLEAASEQLFDQFCARIECDVRTLQQGWARCPEGDASRILATVAVATAALAVEHGKELLAVAQSRLLTELTLQVLPDGGHVSRDPAIAADLLADLIPLSQLYVVNDLTPPAELSAAIRALSAFVAAFRLGDGSPSALTTHPSRAIDRMRAALDLVPPLPVVEDGSAGLVRIASGATILLVDTGANEVSPSALAFEQSDGRYPLIVSSGVGPAVAPVGRFATLCVDQAWTRTTSPPSDLLSARHGSTYQSIGHGDHLLDATHAGFARHGFAHRRVLELSADGKRLAGRDTLRPLAGEAEKSAVAVSLHFPLHPDVRVERGETASSKHLVLSDGTIWQLTANKGRLSVEDNVVIMSGRSTRAWQIVLRASWPMTDAFEWTLERIEASMIV